MAERSIWHVFEIRLGRLLENVCKAIGVDLVDEHAPIELDRRHILHHERVQVEVQLPKLELETPHTVHVASVASVVHDEDLGEREHDEEEQHEEQHHRRDVPPLEHGGISARILYTLQQGI